MSGRYLGDVFFNIRPNTTGFGTQTQAQVTKALAGVQGTVSIKGNVKDVDAAIAGLRARAGALNDQLGKLRASANTKQVESVIASLQAKLAALDKLAANLTMGADTKKLDAQIAAEAAKLKGLQNAMSNLVADAKTTAAAAKIAALEKQSADLSKRLAKMKSDVDINAAQTKLAAIAAELGVLRSDALAVKLNADNRALNAAIAESEAKLTTLRTEAGSIKMHADASGFAQVDTGLLGIEAAIEGVTKKSPAMAHALGQIADASAASTKSAFSWALLTSHVQLFGGILQGILPKLLSTVTVWHLLADGFVEFAAVLIPAAIAWGAFAAAAIKSSDDIYKRLTAINTEINATGRSVPQLSGSFAKLSEQVRPEVYQLFGEALVEAQHNTGGFAYVANAAGKSLDQLGARFVAATTQGKGVSDFMKGAATDAAEFGTLIGNLGGIFGNLLAAMPGIAEHLLSIGVAMTHVIEVFTQVAKPVINFVLLVHGVVIWTGIAVTAALAFVGVIAKMIQGLLTLAEAQTLSGLAAIKDFGIYLGTAAVKIGRYVAGLYAIAAGNVAAGESSGILAAGLTALSDVPIIVWVALAAAAITGIVYALTRGDVAVKAFNATLQKTIENSAIPNVLQAISVAQTQATDAVAKAQVKLAATTRDTGDAANYAAKYGGTINRAMLAQRQTTKDLQTVQQGLGQQYTLVSGRLGGLSKTYGGNTAALGALNAAGITTAQVLDTNKQHWQQTLIQVEATTQAYQLMGAQSGQLGNDLDVLGRTETTQYQAIQKLNQAWTAFIADVTGTQDSFDTVAQGFETLSTHSQDIKLSLGKLKTGFSDAKAGIDSLTGPGIALNQAFGQQVVNIDKLISSLRTAALGNGEFQQGVRDAIQPMLQYAKGSSEATAQLVALAEEAGYTGPNSFQKLTEWVGHTKNATQDLKNITNDATVQEALLTNALTAQGNYMANVLSNDISNAILKYSGVEQAARNYGKAIADYGQQSVQAKSAQDVLIQGIIQSGEAAHKTTGEIAAMITKVTGIPAKKALQIVMTGTGSYTISQAFAKANPKNQSLPGNTPGGVGAAAGGYINMAGRLMRAAGGMIDLGTGPKADDVPAMLSKGEYVVQAASVSKYGKSMMDAINGGRYAAGGPVGGQAASNAAVTSGQLAVTMSDQFQQQMTTAMVTSMQASLKTAEAAAKTAAAAAASAGGAPGAQGGPATGGAAAAQAYARSRLGAFGWSASQMPPLISLWNQECVPLRVRILTRRGWLTCDEVQPGDETIGYNPDAGHSEWTKITAVNKFGPTPVKRFGNQYWSAECTANHRWLAEAMGTQYRYGPRPDRVILERREVVKGESLVELGDLRKSDRVVLARPAHSDNSLPVSVREAALLGWIAGDGSVPELRDYWYDRKLELAPTPEAPFGYRLDGRPKKGGSGAPRKTGQRRKSSGLIVRITQAKPEYFAAIDDACASDPRCGYGTESRIKYGDNRRDVHVWRLSAAYSRDLLARAGNPKTDAVAQVLAMSDEQRAAWLEAITAAEGTRSGDRVLIYQDDGPVADAIELAIYMAGKRPARSKDPRHDKVTWRFGSVSPHIGGKERRRFIEDAGTKEVWCPTTELGTWTAGQDGQVFLTGNSGWNRLAKNPSSGAYGIPQALPGSKMGAAANPPTSSMAAQVNWGLGYIKTRPGYGSPAAAWAHEVAFNWYAAGGLIPGGTYDRGGFLPPGLSVAFNGTGKPEPVGHLAPGPGGELAGLFGGLLGHGLGKLPGAVAGLSGAVSGLGGLLGQLQAAGGLPGIVVGAGTPAGAGGFGLTRGDLGLPATTDDGSGSAAGGDTGAGTGDSGTGTTTPVPAKKPVANGVQKLAAAQVRKLMGGYIWHNYLAQAKEANVTLNYLMDHTYDAKLGQVEFLDGVLASAQKRKNKTAEKAAEKLLAGQGVHVWKIQNSVKGNAPRDKARKTVDELMKGYIYNNNMTSAGQANALLTHWGETKYTPELNQIKKLDTLLAKYTKAKDAADVKATEALLKSYGVHNFKVIGTPAGGAGGSSGSGGGSGNSGGSGTGADATLAKLRATLTSRQKNEVSAYSNLTSHYAQALAGAKPGSYIAGHKTSITSELGTLAKRQAAEKSGYGTLAGKGLTAAQVSHFGAVVRSELSTAGDKYLDQGEPALTTSLKYWLNALNSTASAKFPGKAMGGTVMDHGGWLAPGWNPPVWNGTGRPEPVGPAATNGNTEVVAELRALRGHIRELTNVTAAGPAATGRHVASAVQAGGPSTALSIRYPRTWS